MRISDWSSDVCSSDLPDPLPKQKRGGFMNREALIAAALAQLWTASALAQAIPSDSAGGINSGNAAEDVTEILVTAQKRSERRSEEHTSELQSLMRISYAVFCLNTKTKTLSPDTQTNTKTY